MARAGEDCGGHAAKRRGMADLEWTVKQAAQALVKSERTVRRYLAQGRLRGRKVAGPDSGPAPEKWLIEAASVRSLAADLRADTTTGQTAADTIGQVADELRSLRQENAEYRELLSRLLGEIEKLRAAVQLSLPAPGPGEGEGGRPWWRRLWGRARRGPT